MKRVTVLLTITFIFISKSIYPQKVELLGPPCGVNILSMKIHPQYSDYLYSSESANASFFRTTDGGLTNEWIDLQNEAVPGWIVGCDYQNPDVYYNSISGTGYFKTIDGGKSWGVSLFSALQNYDLIVNPLNSNSLLVIHNGTEIWKSYDAGESWFHLATIDSAFELTQLEISHQDTSILYTTGENRLFKSTDAGLNWELTTKFSNTLGPSCYRMEVLPTNDKLIYFRIGGNFYRSTDGGDTIQYVLGAVTDWAVNPFSPEIIYATSYGDLYLSTDAGNNWKLYNEGFPFSNIQAGEIEISQQNPDILYISTYYGIYKTTNGGDSWFYTRSAYTNARRLITFKEDPGSLLALTRRSDLMKTTDNGETWFNPAIDTFARIGFDFFAINPFNESNGYLANGFSLYKTTDYGNSWFDTGKLPGEGEVKYHPYMQDVIFARSYKTPFVLHRSTNGGNNWEFISDTSTSLIISNQLNPYKIFSLDNYGIRRSTDLGSSWNLIKKSEPANIQTAIAMPSNSEDIIYRGLSANSDLPGHLFKSTNGGDSWIEIDSVLHQLDHYVSISSIAIDNEDPKRVFVGLSFHGYSDGGLYLTEDDGKSWIKLFNSRVDFIQMYYGDPKYIYFGTKFGIMRMRDSALVAVNEYPVNNPSEYSLFQNYPNPFNPTTVIKYQIPENGYVTLKIYDILGKEITTLVNEEKSAGKYEVNFNASSLSSGVYIYQVKVNGFVSTRKMMLMK